MLRERIQVLNKGAESRPVVPLQRRLPVPSRVPCKHGAVRHLQFVDNVLHAARMFMPAMKQNNRAWLIRAYVVRRPMAVEQRRAMRRAERSFFRQTHISPQLSPSSASNSLRQGPRERG